MKRVRSSVAVHVHREGRNREHREQGDQDSGRRPPSTARALLQSTRQPESRMLTICGGLDL